MSGQTCIHVLMQIHILTKKWDQRGHRDTQAQGNTVIQMFACNYAKGMK